MPSYFLEALWILCSSVTYICLLRGSVNSGDQDDKDLASDENIVKVIFWFMSEYMIRWRPLSLPCPETEKFSSSSFQIFYELLISEVVFDLWLKTSEFDINSK